MRQLQHLGQRVAANQQWLPVVGLNPIRSLHAATLLATSGVNVWAITKPVTVTTAANRCDNRTPLDFHVREAEG